MRSRVLARLDECEETRLSAYRLMGELFVRNLTQVIGYQKELAFLWEGFNMSEIDQKLYGITAALGISGAEASKLKELGEKLRTTVGVLTGYSETAFRAGPQHPGDPPSNVLASLQLANISKYHKLLRLT
ncbi:hypothetical protein MRX96_039538 [Rhipicephalus microplus]